MTFDDGILKIYKVENSAPSGSEPVEQLHFKEECYYHQEALGYNRYYTALQAHQKIDMVVDVPDWIDVSANDVCIPENDLQYTVNFVQKSYDDNNLKITKITLGRLGENYDIQNV